MYNGIGLQTPRGSGTNGYIQNNKFFVRPKTNKADGFNKGFETGEGTAGVTRKPNKDILEHDRKRQIQLKLVELEDKLIDQGYTDAEIAEKIEEVRNMLEAAAASEDNGGPTALIVADKKISDTQTHQIAARKEKQMETLRAAFGIASSEPNELSNEGKGELWLENDSKKGADVGGKHHEKREHSFLARDNGSKKHMAEDPKSGKEAKKKGSRDLTSAKKRGHKSEKSRHRKKEGSRGSMREDDSSDEDSSEENSTDVEITGKKKKNEKLKKKKGKHSTKHVRRREHQSSSSGSETDDDDRNDDTSDDDSADKVSSKRDEKQHKRTSKKSDSDSSSFRDEDFSKHRRQDKKTLRSQVGTEKKLEKSRIQRHDSESEESDTSSGEKGDRHGIIQRKSFGGKRSGGENRSNDKSGKHPHVRSVDENAVRSKTAVNDRTTEQTGLDIDGSIEKLKKAEKYLQHSRRDIMDRYVPRDEETSSDKRKRDGGHREEQRRSHQESSKLLSEANNRSDRSKMYDSFESKPRTHSRSDVDKSDRPHREGKNDHDYDKHVSKKDDSFENKPRTHSKSDVDKSDRPHREGQNDRDYDKHARNKLYTREQDDHKGNKHRRDVSDDERVRQTHVERHGGHRIESHERDKDAAHSSKRARYDASLSSDRKRDRNGKDDN